MSEQEEYDALKARITAGENICVVYFAHDLENGWYEIKCPLPSQNGAWSSSKNIADLCKRKGWKIIWFGDQQYNPWKKTS